MKKMKLLPGLLFVLSIAGNAQQVKIISVNPADHKKKLYNEYWCTSEGPVAAVHFKEYFFAQDGTYVYTYGYSGGAYWRHDNRGTYSYAPRQRQIKIKGRQRRSGKMSPEYIRGLSGLAGNMILENMTDSTVTISGSPSVKAGRIVGVTSDQYWFKGPDSSHDCIDFQLSGQAIVTQEQAGRQEFVCSYRLVEGFLLLEVRSLTIYRQNVQSFTPAIRTYLKVRVEDHAVLVEQADLQNILDGQRNWTFKDMKFYIDNAGPAEKAIPWDRYNRVKNNTRSK